jgi:hypothetical protein
MELEAENISLKVEVKANVGNRFGDPESLLERVNELEFENKNAKSRERYITNFSRIMCYLQSSL